MDELLQDAIDKGLMKIAKVCLGEANRQYQGLKEMEGTKKQEGLDLMSGYIKFYQRN